MSLELFSRFLFCPRLLFVAWNLSRNEAWIVGCSKNIMHSAIVYSGALKLQEVLQFLTLLDFVLAFT